MRTAIMVAILAFGACWALAPARLAAAQGEGARDEGLPVVLFPRREAVLSAEVSGTVTALARQMGERFAAGDVLVSLDDELFAHKVQKAKAELTAAETICTAFENLYKSQSKSLMELAEARRNLEEAKFALFAAEKELKSCRISAPYAGRLVENLAQEHELVRAGQAAVRILDDGVVRARILAPAALFGKIRLGDAVAVTIPEAGEFPGKVVNISAALDSASGTFEAVAEIDNAADKLRAGMMGRAVLRQAE